MFRLRNFHTSTKLLAGHSKWQNIKHRKARQDASRSSQNTKIANMITVAVKEGGGPDLSMNVRLSTLVENATKMSIPKKVIESAIARGSGVNNVGENATQIVYEGVGPGGVAFVVETLTSNKNRSAQQVRACFLKYKGSLSPSFFMFERRGWIEVKGDFDEVFEQCMELDVLDVVKLDENVLIYTDPVHLSAVAKQLGKIEDMGMAFVPLEDQKVSVDEEVGLKIKKLIDELEDLEDVSAVYTNERQPEE